ncbi:MAG: hypothetical protein WDM90_15655 [Ferruginibacter sp.]
MYRIVISKALDHVKKKKRKKTFWICTKLIWQRKRRRDTPRRI